MNHYFFAIRFLRLSKSVSFSSTGILSKITFNALPAHKKLFFKASLIYFSKLLFVPLLSFHRAYKISEACGTFLDKKCGSSLQAASSFCLLSPINATDHQNESLVSQRSIQNFSL